MIHKIIKVAYVAIKVVYVIRWNEMYDCHGGTVMVFKDIKVVYVIIKLVYVTIEVVHVINKVL